MKKQKISFLSSENKKKDIIKLNHLKKIYGDFSIDECDVIVALGGDGHMLNALHIAKSVNKPVYGMNQGTIGFLMNKFSSEFLLERINSSEETIIHPLRMEAITDDGSVKEALAINEVSLLRSGPQAAKLKISIDDKVRLSELICDGALVSTSAGSTAYNYSAHGPILPINSDVLALTAMSAYRPRRWRGALLASEAKISFETINYEKRPVSAMADTLEVKNVITVHVSSYKKVSYHLLFDPGHGLEERLLQEQFF